MRNFLKLLKQNLLKDQNLIDEVFFTTFQIIKNTILKREDINIPGFLDLKYKTGNYKATTKKPALTKYTPISEVPFNKTERLVEKGELIKGMFTTPVEIIEEEEEYIEFIPDKELITEVENK